MIIFEVYKNGKLLTRAGKDDLNILHAILNSHCQRDDDYPEELLNTLSVGGMVSGKEKNIHMNWVDFEPIEPGDEVTIKVLEGDNVDPPLREKTMLPEDYKKEES